MIEFQNYEVRMSKQHLEGIMRDLFKINESLWFVKFQTIPLAYTKNPADFIVLTPTKRCLVECKECSTDIFVLSRLSQLTLMKKFEQSHADNNSYVVVCFYRRGKKKSMYWVDRISVFDSLIVSGVKRLHVDQLKLLTYEGLEKWVQRL